MQVKFYTKVKRRESEKANENGRMEIGGNKLGSAHG
jgi:hypothetical protein